MRDPSARHAPGRADRGSRAGFETGAAVARDGPLSGPDRSRASTGPTRWKAIFPLAKPPAGTEILLAAGGAPLLVRHERTFVLLANPDENGWSSVPSFPLTIARLVEVAGAGAAARPGLDRASAVLSSAETHVARGEPLPPRAPAAREAVASDATGRCATRGRCWRSVVLIVIASRSSKEPAELGAPGSAGQPNVTSRRGGATTRTRPASARAGATRRTARS